MEENKKYDVGIFGLWYGHNYGSIVTYYALDNVIRLMGYSTVMIKNPLGMELDTDSLNSLRKSHALKFAARHYNITPLYRISQMNRLNEVCDKFLLGSDQMWNYGLSRPYQQSYFLDFASNDKIKVAYATSFGKEKYEAPEDYKAEARQNLNRFTAISVRDDFSKEICKNEFEIAAEQVIDPVFLCPTEKYEQLIEEASKKYFSDFFFAYILDPNPEWGKTICDLSKKIGKRAIVIFDEGCDKQKAVERLNIDDKNIEYFMDADLCEWLCCFKNADFVVTDSFHGACFSMIFHKSFVVLKNNRRGGSRFNCLLDMAGLKLQMVTNVEQIENEFEGLILNRKIDYSDVEKRIDEEKNRAYEWLKKALKGEIHLQKSQPIVAFKQDNASISIKLHPDIERARMLISLLKEYGLRHIVISSGTRDLSLARIIENNKSFFQTYLVTDERSAAYFAVGLSIKINQPVVIMCTSGTAVSNYLPGITEAFYQKVPIVVITGDRYAYYIDQMEPQMIKQYGLFRDVSKCNVTLDIEDTKRCRWSNYTKICKALLEVDHHGKGPVHINFPIDIVEHNPPDPSTYILPKIEKITRVDFYSGKDVWCSYTEQLCKANKIMLIYGQNNPLSVEEKKWFDMFTEKFNCVVLVDHLSNVSGKYCLNPYRLLKRWTNNQFKTNLMPEICIYVGGKRTLNDPLSGKMRSIGRRLNFWHVTESGEISDMYYKLSHIFECNQTQFFKFFSENAGYIKNNEGYYNQWKQYADT